MHNNINILVILINATMKDMLQEMSEVLTQVFLTHIFQEMHITMEVATLPFKMPLAKTIIITSIFLSQPIMDINLIKKNQMKYKVIILNQIILELSTITKIAAFTIKITLINITKAILIQKLISIKNKILSQRVNVIRGKFIIIHISLHSKIILILHTLLILLEAMQNLSVIKNMKEPQKTSITIMDFFTTLLIIPLYLSLLLSHKSIKVNKISLIISNQNLID